MRAASLALPDYREALLDNPEAIELPSEHIAADQVVVADVAGDPVGFVVVIAGSGKGECELDGLFVAPEYWRRGIGRTLLEDACSKAVSRGATAMTVVASPSAEYFYRSCGFIRSGTVSTRFGPAISMRRAIGSAY